MIAYLGDTRSRSLLARARAANVGQIIVRGRLRGRRLARWAYDNGAFEDFRQGREFDDDAFVRDVNEIATMVERPAFLVLPDIVAGGLESLRLSMQWRETVPPWPWFLAVQDGMEPRDVPWSSISGVFVGGSLPWKLQRGGDFVRAAHERGLPAHVGRVGTARRIAWARDIGADSIDSCLPLWSKENARAFFDAIVQEGLFK